MTRRVQPLGSLFLKPCEEVRDTFIVVKRRTYLIPERNAVAASGDTAKLYSESLESTAQLGLDVLAATDQPPSRRKYHAEPIGFGTLDVDLSEPTCPRQLREALGIGTVRLVQTCGQRFMGLAGVNADDR